MRLKQAKKISYLKRKFSDGSFEILYRAGFELRRIIILAFDISFSRYADCQLGGGSQENVSIVSARGGPKMGIFSVS